MSDFDFRTTQPIDETGHAWQTMRRYIEHRLENLRAQLENPATPADKDMALKGRIQAFKDMLAMPEQLRLQRPPADLT